ncbi:hypothetical protein [Nostoc sp.]|uniref:hypothetical protein n=1 Tax=Nostoc sp. TaxID=1180 RepID=UPI002FF92288
MSGKVSRQWLQWANKIEDEVNCDVEAGLDLGKNLGDYLLKSQNYIDRRKLICLLKEELGNLLSEEEIDIIANATQNCVRDRIQVKIQSTDVA